MLHYVVEFLLNVDDLITNYLDNVLFVAVIRQACDDMMQTFIDLCTRINCPLSEEKTEWSSPIMIFLGTLLDGKRHCLCIAEEKKVKALNQIRWIRSKHTATVKQIQCLTGILNFLNCAIVPGRVFTRCMYSKLKVIDKYG